ncbi:MAG: hypothetical protein Q9183_007814 [Haloplaca sp. 2 TL-2023]
MHCTKPPYIFGGVSAAPSFSPAMDRTPVLKLFPDAVFDIASFKDHMKGQDFVFNISTPSAKSTHPPPVGQQAAGDGPDLQGINAQQSLDSSNRKTAKRSAGPVDDYPTALKPTKLFEGRDKEGMSGVRMTRNSAKGKPRKPTPVNFADPVPSWKPEVGTGGQPPSKAQSTAADRISAVFTPPTTTMTGNGRPPIASATLGSSSKPKRCGEETTGGKGAARPAEDSGAWETARMNAGSPWSQRKSQKKESTSRPETDLTERYGNLSLGPRHLNPVYDDARPGSNSKSAAAAEPTEHVEEGEWEDSPVF